MVWLTMLLSAVGALFWYNDWVYQLPTPIPDGYQPVHLGTPVALTNLPTLSKDKPVLLHFFNPGCPCSRFNAAHFRSLVRQYRQQVDVVVVVMSDKTYSVEEIQKRLGADVPVVFDQSVAKRCGVYSTPQAVLLDKNRHLYYRGNYNRSRYCVDEKTSYAKLALAHLLHNRSNPDFDPLALKAYGCSAPYCKTN